MFDSTTNDNKRLDHYFDQQLNQKKQVKFKTCADVYDYWRTCKRLYKKAPKDGVEFQVEYIDTGLALDEEARAKAPIALALHGAPGSYHDFSLLIRHLSKQNVRVIAPNFPEYIATVKTKVLFRHSADEKAAYLRDFLKTINVNKIDLLVSHSSAIFPTLLILLNANNQAIAKQKQQQANHNNNTNHHHQPDNCNKLKQQNQKQKLKQQQQQQRHQDQTQIISAAIKDLSIKDNDDGASVVVDGDKAEVDGRHRRRIKTKFDGYYAEANEMDNGESDDDDDYDDEEFEDARDEEVNNNTTTPTDNKDFQQKDATNQPRLQEGQQDSRQAKKKGNKLDRKKSKKSRRSREDVIVKFDQPIEIKAVALLNPAGHRMPKSMKPCWFKCGSCRIYQHKLGRSLFRKLGPAFLTVVGVPVRVDNMDNVMLSATVMRNSKCHRVVRQLQQLSEMQLPTLLVFSENDKLIEKEIFYEMTQFMKLDQKNFDIFNNDGDIEVSHSSKKDWIRVMVFKAGGHYAYSNYANTVNNAVSELLEKVVPQKVDTSEDKASKVEAPRKIESC